jgi:hypothetical protein
LKKPCQTFQNKSTQERERKRNKGQGPKSKQTKQPKRGKPQGGKGTTKRISNVAQYVTPDSKIYREKVKMCQFSSRNCFFCTKFMELAVAGKWRNTVVHLQKQGK